MNENAKLWVHTLRSGQYEQTKGALRSKDRFCCLGVACDLYDEGGWAEDDFDPRGYRVDGEELDDILPNAVKRWLGLRTSMGKFESSDGIFPTLVDVNDDGVTFEEIADLIEKHQDQLFVKENANE